MAAYTPVQLARYLIHISFPRTNGPYTPDNLPAPTLPTLQHLVAHHLATVPFESISLHYSPTRLLDLDPESLFRKIVRLPNQDPGAAPSVNADQGPAEAGALLGGEEWADLGGDRRGGYCMEVDAFFAAVLRGLGYDVVTCGGRVSYVTQGQDREGFSGWNHMVNLVTIDNIRYLVDVGFGFNTPHYPIPIPSFTPSAAPAPAVAPNDLRKITIERLPNSHPSAPKLYIYSHRPSPSAPWIAGYAFTDVEFFPADFTVMNLSTMTNSFFTESVLSVRHFLEHAPDRKTRVLAGQVVMHGTEVRVRRRLRKAGAGDVLSAALDGAQGPDGEEYGPYETLETFSTEDGRIAALRKWFGVVVSDEDRKGIVGLASELKG